MERWPVALDSQPQRLCNRFLWYRAVHTTFPTTSGVVQPTHTAGVNLDVFVTKLNSTLTAPLVYSTFLERLERRIRHDDSRGLQRLCVCWGLDPVSSNFPTTTGALQTAVMQAHRGEACPVTLDEIAVSVFYCGDVFVSKLAQNASSLVFSTYLGGSQDEGAMNMALDSSENVWVTGAAESHS